MNIVGPLLFALLAAVGNAFFAFGQRKAAGVDNSFVFITISLMVCVLLCIVAAPFFGSVSYATSLRNNAPWAVTSGVGLFLTYIGFNLLYSNYGASSYILYAVLSVITTTVIVGAFILRENLNLYHWLAVASALLTVALYSWGNKVG